MANNYNYRICLGIPIPRSIQALPRTPPVSFHHQGDLSSLEALKDFGKEFDIPCDEIDQACNLASGPADIVVILERPKERSSHNYGHPFPQFVTCCKTLWAVDEVIQFATNGARSIHTVTVLDAFSFKPKNCRSHIPDERCHRLLADIMRAKNPKVVIRCHTDEYKDPWMKQFGLPWKDCKSVRKEIQAGGTHRTTILQSFHPSVAVNHYPRRPEYRCLLIHHFIAVFAELSGVPRHNEEAEEIRRLCMKTRYISLDISSMSFTDYPFSTRNREELSSWDAQTYMINALEWQCCGPRRGYSLDLEWSESERLRREAKILWTMYDQLENLAGKSDTFGAYRTAKAVLLWEEYFETDPLYNQVTTLLLFKGSEQQGWFPTANDSLTSTEKNSDFLGWTSIGQHSPEIIEVNKRAVECISNALPLEEGEEAGTTHPVDTHCQATSNEIADLVEKQNSLVDEYLRPSPLTQFSGALKIQRMNTQCKILAQIMKCENYCVDEPKDKQYEDLMLLRSYLQQLVSA